MVIMLKFGSYFIILTFCLQDKLEQTHSEQLVTAFSKVRRLEEEMNMNKEKMQKMQKVQKILYCDNNGFCFYLLLFYSLSTVNGKGHIMKYVHWTEKNSLLLTKFPGTFSKDNQ